MNRRLRNKTDNDTREPTHIQQQSRRLKRKQTAPIDLEEEETCKEIIRKTRAEKMMDRFQFGRCIEVDGHPVVEHFNDGDIENIAHTFNSQEQLPADEDLPNDANSIHRDDCCPVCLERYVGGDILCIAKTESCSHVFHKGCMIQWIRRHNRCPICRTNVMHPDEGPSVGIV